MSRTHEFLLAKLLALPEKRRYLLSGYFYVDWKSVGAAPVAVGPCGCLLGPMVDYPTRYNTTIALTRWDLEGPFREWVRENELDLSDLDEMESLNDRYRLGLNLLETCAERYAYMVGTLAGNVYWQREEAQGQ